MSSVDDTVDRNLDTISRRLAELESATDTALAGGIPDRLPENDTAALTSYAELTAANDRLRTQRRWADIDLDAALTPEQRAGFDRWRARQRIPWDHADILSVGFATVLGVAAVHRMPPHRVVDRRRVERRFEHGYAAEAGGVVAVSGLQPLA